MNNQDLDRLAVASAMPGVVFPGLPRQEGMAQLSLQYQLEESEWWDKETLAQHQYQQLNHLLQHAIRSIPFYKKFFEQHQYIFNDVVDSETLSAIPVLDKKSIYTAGKALLSQTLPEDHGPLWDMGAIGSKEQATTLKGTALTRSIINALQLREHYWHKRDLSLELASILFVKGIAPAGQVMRGWGSAVDVVHNTGDSSLFDAGISPRQQMQWLKQRQPGYLFSPSSNVYVLAKTFIEHGESLNSLKQVRTFGQPVSDELRDLCKQAWNVDVADIYGCPEIRFLAFQCNEHYHYHVQSENVLLEIVNEKNQPCAIGEQGRILITSLNNFAMPLIRYDTGDMASFGEPCGCGRGLPVLINIKTSV